LGKLRLRGTGSPGEKDGTHKHGGFVLGTRKLIGEERLKRPSRGEPGHLSYRTKSSDGVGKGRRERKGGKETPARSGKTTLL